MQVIDVRLCAPMSHLLRVHEPKRPVAAGRQQLLGALARAAAPRERAHLTTVVAAEDSHAAEGALVRRGLLAHLRVHVHTHRTGRRQHANHDAARCAAL